MITQGRGEGKEKGVQKESMMVRYRQGGLRETESVNNKVM